MQDLTAQQFALRLAALVLLISVQGGAMALAAVLLGDPGPRYDKRLSLNLLVHLDLLGLVGGLLFAIGWIKPLTLDPAKMKFGRAAPLVVVAAGFVAVILLILVLGLVRLELLPALSDSPSQTLFAFVDVAGGLGIWFALANLLPIPPFSGSCLLTAWRPDFGKRLVRWQIPAGLVALALAAIGFFAALLGPAEQGLATLLLRQ